MSSEVKQSGHQFGTFGGVFTPSILTIFGLIMFMRANYVVGTAGILQSLCILTLCCTITFLTGLSICAISTNTPVAGGGAYFLISRVLGPSFGTAIGVALFLALALSVPFYILGFAEAVCDSFTLPISFRALTITTLVVLYAVVWVGADWAIRVQYVILAILALAIISFMLGALFSFDPVTFRDNLGPRYADGENVWSMFAIYFPAVTGIMAGVNMSGDLKNPGKSIPVGTLAAIALSYVVYALQIILSGAMAPAAELRQQPFIALLEHAITGTGFLIIAGVVCATLSSAVGSYLGAPRVLQAVAGDDALPILRPFSHGSGPANEPRRALVATFVIGLAVLLLVDNDGGGGLNLVAAVVTMVFLYTYGMTNLAAFVESFGANPSFRPRFAFYHWTTALAGTIACVWSAVMINVGAAVVALAGLAALFLIAQKREMNEAYGDARRGFVYQQVRLNLTRLAGMPVHAKNWRPTVLVFSGNPNARLTLVTYARWLGMKCGIVSLVSVIIGKFTELQSRQREEQAALRKFVDDNRLEVIPETIVMEDFDRDLGLFIRAYSIGPIKPNIVVFGWAREATRLVPYFGHLRTVAQLRRSLVVVVDQPDCRPAAAKRIDLWWRGRRNGSLMVILAHLLLANVEWRNSRLRLLRLVRNAGEVADAHDDLQRICAAARIEADIVVPVTSAPFETTLVDYSSDATLVILGFVPPSEGGESTFHQHFDSLLAKLPTTMLVCSSGDADLLA